MSTQIAVRLPDRIVADIDRLMADGRVRSRAEVVTAALELELRRLAAVQDAVILRELGPADGLDGLVAWTAARVDLAD